jgi:hypothetical protein
MGDYQTIDILLTKIVRNKQLESLFRYITYKNCQS